VTTTILVGDVRERLKDIPDGSVQCCVTSPPYYGLRDYGTAQWDGGDAACDHKPDRTPRTDRAAGESTGSTAYVAAQEPAYRHECGKCGAVRIDSQIGLEPTLAGYIAAMVEVFREVRRVLRDDGVCWLNIGDSYNAQPGQRKETDKAGPKQMSNAGSPGAPSRHESGMKPKDLMMVPARLAIALQDDGWWIRSDVIWGKLAPMPESVTDRPTCAHEHIFLLTKNAKYFYDADAVRTELAASSIDRLAQDVESQTGSTRANGGDKTNGTMKAVQRTDKQRGHSRRHDGFNDRWDAMSKEEQQAGGANLRNVWMLGPDPFSGAHFAVMPREIARRCIKAGSKPGDTILDPFGGSGTTALVADQLGRNAILIELNPAYAELARERITGDAPMFAEVEIDAA
jgi:DNA modification methylase